MKIYKPVQALLRGLKMLERAAVSSDSAGVEVGVTLKDLAQAGGCSVPAAFHLAQTLVEAGFLRREEHPPRFFPGERIFFIAASKPHLHLDSDTARLMQEIRRAIPTASVYFCREHGGDVQVHLQWRVNEANDRLAHDVDYPLPPFTSVGSLMHLAFWPEERVRRYSTLHDFSAHGSILWSNQAVMDALLVQIRTDGYFFLPVKNPRQLRLGFAVFYPDGGFAGSLTVAQDIDDNAAPERSRTFLKQTVLKILRKEKGWTVHFAMAE